MYFILRITTVQDAKRCTVRIPWKRTIHLKTFSVRFNDVLDMKLTTFLHAHFYDCIVRGCMLLWMWHTAVYPYTICIRDMQSTQLWSVMSKAVFKFGAVYIASEGTNVLACRKERRLADSCNGSIRLATGRTRRNFIHWPIIFFRYAPHEFRPCSILRPWERLCEVQGIHCWSHPEM